MSQPASTQQRYFYYVVYAWPSGIAATELYSVGAFTTFEHIEAATKFIQQRNRPGREDIVITNWVLLRTEPLSVEVTA